MFYLILIHLFINKNLFDDFAKSPTSALRLALTVAPIGLKQRTACHPSLLRSGLTTHAYGYRWHGIPRHLRVLNLDFFLCHQNFNFL